MGARRAALAYCPSSNMFLGDGITADPRAPEGRGQVGLGTDGGCTNNRLSVFEEMRMAALLQRVRLLDGGAPDAATAFELGTRSGAEILGTPQPARSPPACLADLAAVDSRRRVDAPARRHLEVRGLRDVGSRRDGRLGPRATRRRGRSPRDARDEHELLGACASLTRDWRVLEPAASAGPACGRAMIELDGGALTLEARRSRRPARRRGGRSPRRRSGRSAQAREFVDRPWRRRRADLRDHRPEPESSRTSSSHRAERVELQRNLVLSHAGGMGAPLPDVEVRAIMLLLRGLARARRVRREARGRRDRDRVLEPARSPDRARARVRRRLGRSRAAGPRGALSRRRRHGVRRGRQLPAAQALARAGIRAARARDQGRAGAPQRHAPHGRPRRAGGARRRAAHAAGRRHRRDVAPRR